MISDHVKFVETILTDDCVTATDQTEETQVTYSDEEVDHEEYVECQVNLLGLVICPWNTGLYSVTRLEQSC